jgi:hypothetical protein
MTLSRWTASGMVVVFRLPFDQKLLIRKHVQTGVSICRRGVFPSSPIRSVLPRQRRPSLHARSSPSAVPTFIASQSRLHSFLSSLRQNTIDWYWAPSAWGFTCALCEAAQSSRSRVLQTRMLDLKLHRTETRPASSLSISSRQLQATSSPSPEL